MRLRRRARSAPVPQSARSTHCPKVRLGEPEHHHRNDRAARPGAVLRAVSVANTSAVHVRVRSDRITSSAPKNSRMTHWWQPVSKLQPQINMRRKQRHLHRPRKTRRGGRPFGNKPSIGTFLCLRSESFLNCSLSVQYSVPSFA